MSENNIKLLPGGGCRRIEKLLQNRYFCPLFRTFSLNSGAIRLKCLKNWTKNLNFSLRFLFSGSLLVAVFILLLSSCATTSTDGTIASLRDVTFEVKEEKIEDSLERAMASYEKFLRKTPETEMTPEAIRRLADLKVQKGHIIIDEGFEPQYENNKVVSQRISLAVDMQTPDTSFIPFETSKDSEVIAASSNPIADISEDEQAFAERAGEKIDLSRLKKTAGSEAVIETDMLQQSGIKQAIELYRGLLEKYPFFERNDQVLYQLSRAYEEIGEIEIAMLTLDKLIAQHPLSRHIDEAQFRRAEYFFTRRRFLDAEESYTTVINFGEGSAFYVLSLYKRGWSLYKQELFEEALQDFIKMLDHKIANGLQLGNIDNKIEQKRIDDTYRVISLSFSNLGGAEAIVDFFDRHGRRFYEASIYSHLGEHYLSKRRFSDAAQSYRAYVERNPLSVESPYFNIRIIEIYKAGGFPRLVIDAKRAFSKTYRLDAEYWTHFDINEKPTVLAFIKSNLIELANHYHALYQDKRLQKHKQKNYKEAIHWYREFLASFPAEKQAPALNKQLAGLFLENKDYLQAAIEFERTAYNYPKHENSSSAGHAAIFAYREHLKVVAQSQRNAVKREIIRSSIKFVDWFPKHEHAPIVLLVAVEDMYALEYFQQTIKYGRRVISDYPNADKKFLRSAWMVIAHASFDIANYKDAEHAYKETLLLTNKQHESVKSLTENLAASVYKQGEQARTLGDHKLAAEHFLRVAKVAPNSVIRPTAEYDAAASLMLLKQWAAVATVLEGLRQFYPDNKLNNDITKKLAIAYKEDGKYLKSAIEFERIEKENPADDALRREALSQAAELYMKVDEKNKVLQVYTKLVDYFPVPIEDTIEIRQRMSDIYLEQGKRKKYIFQLEQIVAGDAVAGNARTDRTRFLAAHAALILAESELVAFKEVKLVKPFQKNLKKKKQRMRSAIDRYTKLVDYQVAEVTAAATYYIAEIYFAFNVALLESERPTGLTAEELEEYEMVIEDQAFPFEEKAISVHQKNLELLVVGIYNKWIDKSIEKLSVLLPARYGKTEVQSNIVLLMQPEIAKPEKNQQAQLEGEDKKAENMETEDLEVEDENDQLPVATVTEKEEIDGGQ